MIQAVIIDDEKSGRLLLAELVKTFTPEVEIIGMADSVKGAVELIQEKEPDLVFLDVEMPTGSGFDVLEQVKGLRFEVIFTTAYDQYAVNAFKVSAIDYLLKPINIELLKSSVAKAAERCNLKKQDDRYQFLLDKLGSNPSSSGRVILPTQDGFKVVQLSQIIRTESEANYTRFHLADKNSFLVSKTMSDYEPILTEFGFYRIHRSHIINMNHVTRYIRGRGGEVELSDGTMLSVARDRKDGFIEALK